MLKLSGLNGCLKSYLKSRINKLPRKNRYKFSVRRCRFIKDISILSFLISIYRSTCIMIETMPSKKTKLQSRFVFKIKILKMQGKKNQSKLIMLNELKLILDELFRIWCGQYQPTQVYLWADFSSPT